MAAISDVWENLGDLGSSVVRHVEGAADFLTVVTSMVALFLAAATITGVSRARSLRRVARIRRRALRRVQHLPSVSRRAHRRRASMRFVGARLTPAWELDWLSHQLGYRTCLTFELRDSRQVLVDVAKAYRSMAADFRTHSWFSTAQALLDEEAQLADQVYELVIERANWLQRKASPAPALALRGAGEFTMSFPTVTPGRSTAFRVRTSWTRSRLTLVGATTRQLAEVDDEQLRTNAEPVPVPPPDWLASFFETEHNYDGILPRLSGWSIASSLADGASVLHLAVTEISYLAHRVFAIPDKGARPDAPDEFPPACIGVSLLVRTRDQRFIVARRRNDDSWYPGTWGPGVSGNLDMPLAGAAEPDADVNGLPDFALAMAREAREEIGLVVDPHAITMLGIFRLDRTATEAGSHVLVGVVSVDLSSEEVIGGARAADPLLGAWEVDQVDSIPVPLTPGQAKQTLREVWRGDHIMPHLAGAVTLYLLQSTSLVDVSWLEQYDPALGVADEQVAIRLSTGSARDNSREDRS